MEFKISTPRYSFSSCALKRNTSYPSQTQHDRRKFVIKDQEPKLYLSLLKIYWVILTSCSCTTLLVQMPDCPQARTQSISKMHHYVCGMWLLSQQSPHTFPEQMYICTCLPSLLVPITASKDLALPKPLPVCCVACVLMQLPVRVVAVGCQLLPRTWPDGFGVQRRGVPYRETGSATWGLGFTIIRSLTFMAPADFVMLLSALSFCLVLSKVSCLPLYFNLMLQTGVIQDERVQPRQHKSQDAPCLTGSLIL